MWSVTCCHTVSICDVNDTSFGRHVMQVAHGLTQMWRHVLYKSSGCVSERIGLANLLMLHKLPALSSKQGSVLKVMLPATVT